MSKKIFTPFFILTVTVGWAIFVEPNLVKTEEIVLAINKLPLEFENLKFVQISDVHFRSFSGKTQKILEILDKINPDFVFITGDTVDWTSKDLERLKKFCSGITKDREDRVFLVLGNHEHKNPKLKKIIQIFKESNIDVLDNDSRKLEINNRFIYLIGVDDPHSDFDDFEKASENIEEEKPKILLAHSPEIFRRVKDKKIDIILTGHTHGCQINLPLLCDLIIPLKYDKKYKRGLFAENSSYLYINRGIGETFLPLRLNSFPEVTLIRLKNK